ncbi:MAG: FISUMP domain-containing protein [Fidelibacterota bacterium]
MFQKLFLVFVFVMASLAYSSDSLTVSGRVVDQEGLGVVNAKIMTEENVSTITHLNGDFEIKISKNYLPVDNPVIIPESYKSYQIKIFNLLGQKVFEKEYKNQTINTFSWDGKNNNGDMLSSGLYFPILEINNKIVSKSKITIVGERIINKTPFVKFENISHTSPNLAKSTSTHAAKFDIIGENFTNITDTVLYISDHDNDDRGEVDDIVLRTFEIDYITDIDSNLYKTVKIGNQWWMAENLKVSRYRNGDPIDDCWAYGDDENNILAYGRLYSWYAVSDSCNIAPEGWHVPTDEEWEELAQYISDDNGGYSKNGDNWNNAGSHLKATTGWNSGENGTDDYGFSGLPAGSRSTNGHYAYIGNYAYFWSASESSWLGAWGRNLLYHNATYNRGDHSKGNGFSVRCIKDEVAPENTAPEASFTSTPAVGTVDTIFTFDASGSSDGEDDLADLQVRWDFDNDNTWDTDYSTTKTITHQFTTAGTYPVKLEVLDTDGATDTATETITVEENSIETGTVTDIDGNTYQTVIINGKEWMAENLKVTKYRNSETISECWTYNNDESNVETYGRLYSWHAVSDSRNIAPEGWHVPTDEEWEELAQYISDQNGGYGKSDDDWYEVGTHLKASSGWDANAIGTDDYGFTGLPAGYRETNGNYAHLGYYAYFWSATECESYNYNAWIRQLNYLSTTFYRSDQTKDRGYSVRCVKD